MKVYRSFTRLITFTVFFTVFGLSESFSQHTPEDPSFIFSPRTYTVFKTTDPVSVNGKLDEQAWQKAEWTELFLDIQGNQLPSPRFETNAKMLWDDHFLYIAAHLEDPHVWATIEDRDAVIFMENNFEIFIDPDGDTHHYYELEINALGTFWDLMLTKPYRNGGRPINAWDIKGLKIGVDILGTLNDPSDTDEGWTLEVAIPLGVLEETNRYSRPRDGTQWRLNFSRVQWQLDVEKDSYIKQKDPGTGEPLPEDNWVWSPQGLINMHLPERWGIVRFSDEAPGNRTVSFNRSEEIHTEWILRELYYRQRSFWDRHGRYAENPDQLNAGKLFEEYGIQADLQINVFNNTYIMSLTAGHLDNVFYIRDDSKAWKLSKS